MGNESVKFPALNPVRSEPFSSSGPAYIRFNSLGNPLVAPQLRQKPDISAPDGGNTSFFGGVMNTTNPPFPGQPSTPTNLSQNLPSFFGTSSAAPNAAAVAALMKSKVPTATPTDIRNALIASASPLNGQNAGTWNVQGGFGMIDSVRAVSLVGGLQVLSTTPGNGQSINTGAAPDRRHLQQRGEHQHRRRGEPGVHQSPAWRLGLGGRNTDSAR